MFRDMREQNIKQSSLGHKDIVFLWSLHFFFCHDRLWNYVFQKRRSRAREARGAEYHDNKLWLSMHPRNFGSDKIVRTTYVPYVHTLHVHPINGSINLDNRERARARNKKTTATNFVGRKTWKFYSSVGKSEKCHSSHQGENEGQ